MRVPSDIPNDDDLQEYFGEKSSEACAQLLSYYRRIKPSRASFAEKDVFLRWNLSGGYTFRFFFFQHFLLYLGFSI